MFFLKAFHKEFDETTPGPLSKNFPQNQFVQTNSKMKKENIFSDFFIGMSNNRGRAIN
jgi:hypothetical protein